MQLNRQLNTSRRKKGFTIVELVIVIAVIAVLAAVLIPTFVSLTKKAHESADIQAARNMNTQLEIDENLNGKPVNPSDAMAVLEKAGYNIEKYVALESKNTLYWDSSENRVLIFSTEGGVIFPEELVKKYSTTTQVPDYWYIFSTAYETIQFTGSTETDFTAAVESLEEGKTLQLTSDITLSSTLPLSISGKTSIDLNGHTLKSTSINSTEISNGNNVTIRNGSLNLNASDYDKASINVLPNSSVTLENVNYKSEGSALYPQGTSAQINVIDSTITAGCYCVGTNAGDVENYGVQISLRNSTLIADNSSNDNCPVMINVAGTLIIDNCTIIGQRQGVIVRAGTAIISNTTIKTTGEYPNKTQYYGAKWGSGNEVPAAGLTIGNFVNGTTTSYAAPAVVTLTNTTVTADNGFAVIYIDSNDSYAAKLTYDSKVADGDITYGQNTSNIYINGSLYTSSAE